MVATPFKASLSVVYAKTGRRQQFTLAGSDVAAAALTNLQDGSTELQLDGEEGGITIIDLNLASAPVDTVYADIYANGRIMNNQALFASNAAAVVGRQFEKVPFGPFKPGSKLKFVQRA